MGCGLLGRSLVMSIGSCVEEVMGLGDLVRVIFGCVFGLGV